MCKRYSMWLGKSIENFVVIFWKCVLKKVWGVFFAGLCLEIGIVCVEYYFTHTQ